MNKSMKLTIALILGVAAMPASVFARGFGGFGGGGFHAGGFGGGGFGGGGIGGGSFHAGGLGGGGFGGEFGGASGGFRSGGFDAGGVRGSGFNAGANRPGGMGGGIEASDRGTGGWGGYRSGDLGGGGLAGRDFGNGSRPGGFGGTAYGAAPNRGQLNSFLGLPTDAGLHTPAAGSIGRAYVPGPEGAAAGHWDASGHVYEGPGGVTVAHGVVGGRGVVEGPGGVAAGGGVAGGTVIKGPEGNVYAHGASAGRGIAAGPEGVVAGSHVASGTVAKGAEGNVYAHGASAGRGIAVGPEGAVAGSHVSGGTAVRGPEGNIYARGAAAGRGIAVGPEGAVAARGAVAGRGVITPAGTHYFSPTYARAQAIAGRGWFVRHPVFTPGWAVVHPWAWYPARYNAAAWAAAVWAVATWPNVVEWLGYVEVPVYNYTYGQDIVYQGDQVYYAGQPAGTAQQYYQQAASLADSNASSQPSQDSQWLPLGVFGLMAEGQKTPEMVFQLAVDKQGVIRGNYYNQVSDATLPVVGAIDKKSQRAAWRVGDNKNLVVETGLYNLTQDESTALVHFGAGRTQQYLLVRVEQPSTDQENQQ